MRSVQVRRFASGLHTLFSIALIFIGCTFPPSFILEIPPADRAIYYSACITLTATIGGLIAVIYFMTAQTRPMGVKDAAVGALYRDSTFTVLLLAISSALLASLLGLVSTIPQDMQPRLLVISSVASMYVALGILPTAAIQFENMNSSAIAAKVLRELSPATVRAYGLVEVVRTDQGEQRVELKTNGLDYDRRDPLRAFHELVERAIANQDRLLLGKLLGALFERVCYVLQVHWPAESSATLDWKPRQTLVAHLRPVTDEELAVAIHALHYAVRLARNLHKAWSGLDVGRHSAQYQIAKLITAIAPRDGVEVVSRVALSAEARISLAFRDVEPYGRVEPLNALATSVAQLERHRRTLEVGYALCVLAGISHETSQLSGDRGAPLRKLLSQENLARLEALESKALNGSIRITEPSFDPWITSAKSTEETGRATSESRVPL